MCTEVILLSTVKNKTQEDINSSIQNSTKKPPKFPFLIRRFIEILAASIICSIPIALLYQFGFTRAEIWATRLMGTSLVAFILLNAYLLRAFFFSMGSRKIYFSVNAIAYLMFSVVNIATLFFKFLNINKRVKPILIKLANANIIGNAL